MSPDYSPIIREDDGEGLPVDCGWGTYGYKAAPITAATLAEQIETGRRPN